MGSQTLEILRQGVLASLTGGWFYDVHQNVFCNAVHLYIWLFLLFLPFIIYMYFPTAAIVWSLYCVLIAIIIGFFKFLNMALHRMYDKARTMSETDLKKPVKSTRETSGENDTGIEMQILRTAEVVETPPVDMSSRTSVERHSDEISCANSAMSIDYQEQVASTIDLKVDVHRKNSSESSDSNGGGMATGSNRATGGAIFSKSNAHSSSVQTQSAEICSTATHKRSLSTPNQTKSSEMGEDSRPEVSRDKDAVDADEGAVGGETSKDGGKKSATLRRHQYKSKRKERFMNSQLQRQISLDSEKIGMGIDADGEASGGAQLQRHLSSEDQNNKSNTSLFHHHHHHHHLLALQNLDPDLYMDHNYTKSAVQLAVENIPGETTSKIYLLQQSTPMRRDSNSTMSALQLPTMAGNSFGAATGKNRRHSNVNASAAAGVRPLPRSLTSVRRIKSAALETCSPSSISNLAPTHPNSVEVIGGQTLRNPQHTVIPPPSKCLSRNPHLNLFPKVNGENSIGLMVLSSANANSSNVEPVYPIAEQADESTPVKNLADKVETFQLSSDSDNGCEDDDDNEDEEDEEEDDDDDEEEDDDEETIDRLQGAASEEEGVHTIHTYIHRHHHHHHQYSGPRSGAISRQASLQHSQQSNPPSQQISQTSQVGTETEQGDVDEQDTGSDLDQPAMQSTDSDTENNAGSRSPLLEPRNRPPLVIVEAKNPCIASSTVEAGIASLKFSKSSDKIKKPATLTIEDSPVKQQGFEENGGPSSSDWEQASASSKDLLITKERSNQLGMSEGIMKKSSSGVSNDATGGNIVSGQSKQSPEKWLEYTSYDAALNEDHSNEPDSQPKKENSKKEFDREKSATVPSEAAVTISRNLGAIPKTTNSSRFPSRRLSAEENYPSTSSKIYNRTLSQRLSAERIPENATAAPLITFLNYHPEVPIPSIYLPGNSSLSEQHTSSFTSFRRPNAFGSDRNYRQIQCRLRMSRSKHPVVSMEPNTMGSAGPSGPNGSIFRDDDNNNYSYCLDSMDNPTTSSSRSVGGSSSTFHDQTEVPLNLFVDEPERWVQLIERSTIEDAIKERIAMSHRGGAIGGSLAHTSGDNNCTSINSSGIDKAMAPTEYSLSSAQSAIDVVPRSMFGEPQIRPKRYYKLTINLLCLKEVSISMNRLQLLALFDRDTNYLQVCLAVVLCMLVSLLGAMVLYLKFYEDLYAFIFCFVIAGSQYSLLKSVQPDAASPIHGFNKTVTYSRPIYFCLCSSLLLTAHHILRDYQTGTDTVGPRAAFFGFQISIIDFLQYIQSILSVVILLFPFLFSLGLFPQINTFAMYFLEQIDMHIFGSNASCSLLSSFLSVVRSILACTLLFGPAYGGLSETGTQHVLFSMFCAFLITVSYHLSRCTSDFTYIWAVIKSSLIVHPDYDDNSKEDSKMSTDSDENKTSTDSGEHQRSSDEIHHKDVDEEANRESVKELDDPLPKKLQSTVTVRLKNDAVVCVVLSLVIFSLHCSTVFTVLQPDINYVLHTGACILGFLIHYIIPQLRKHLPWLCIAKPILKPKEFGQFEVQNLSKIMWFETMYVGLCFFERNILYPLIFLSALTADSGAIAQKFGLTLGTTFVVVSGLKCVRNAYSDVGSQYIILIFTVLFFRIDYKLSSETFLIDYFFVSILYRKISEFLLKLQFVVTYIAPWQITWGSAFHAFAQPFSVPHSAMLFLQTAISALLSTPLNPFLGSAIFLTSYVRPIKFWERDYNTRRIDHSNTRLSSQLERDLGADDNNLNSIFYEHLTRSLQHSLCGDLLMGRWGNVSQGDCFVLASDYLNCLVHIIELGNGLCTFQMRGLEFRGTYCQQREVEAISEEVEENIGCCCCTVGHLPRMLSANAMFTTRWLAWQVMASKYVLEGYSISDNSATATLQVFEFRKVLISYYVKSIIYYAIRSPKLSNWLQSQAIEEALEHTLDRQFVDLDPVFNHNLDDDYDFRSAGITRASFWNVYGEWIQFCCEKKRQQMQAALSEKNTPRKTTTSTAAGNTNSASGPTVATASNSTPNDSTTKAGDVAATNTAAAAKEPEAEQSSSSGNKQPTETESGSNGAATFSSATNCSATPGTSSQPFFNSGRDSLVTSLCMALALLARRTLATASHSSSSGVEFFLHGLHALFKGDFRITSTRDEWVFADMELLHGVVAPAVRMSLKLHQDHFLCPDEYDDYGALFNAIDYHTKELVISHEADPLWRSAVLRGTPNLLALRHVMDDGSDEYRVIRLSKRFLSFRVIKLNRECVRGLWAGQQQELIYLRNRNPERGSIQNAKQALRNIINSSCDQPIGYPIYVSPLTTSYAETNPQLCKIIGGEITLEKLQHLIINCWNRVRQRCREGCSSGSAIIDNEMGELQGVYPTPNNTLSGTAGTLSYGSQNMSLSGAANRGSLASINKPTSSTLLAGFLNRERDSERDTLRDRAGVTKRCNLSSNSKDRIDRALAASKRESFKETLASGSGLGSVNPGVAGSTSSGLKQQGSVESTSGNPRSVNSSSMNLNVPNSNAVSVAGGSSVMFTLAAPVEQYAIFTMDIDAMASEASSSERIDKNCLLKAKARGNEPEEQVPSQWINAPPTIGLNRKVIIVDAAQIYDCLDLGRRIDVIWPNEQLRSCGGRSSWKDWQPQEGMVGNVIHYWQPNHPDHHFRSNVNRTILLVKIGDHCVPVGEKGVKEYNTVGLPATDSSTKSATTLGTLNKQPSTETGSDSVGETCPNKPPETDKTLTHNDLQSTPKVGLCSDDGPDDDPKPSDPTIV
ncbi:protein pecanex isoform X2 [Wyeomyia smithii]|uniref:protein pecanex isoform X2 n=1 Tax=Wyeomyia smithii TaxID=174621 RepID=UPI002467BFC6|nr:protein pecanex isoform X2 [Wyeomyia smithii]